MCISHHPSLAEMTTRNDTSHPWVQECETIPNEGNQPGSPTYLCVVRETTTNIPSTIKNFLKITKVKNINC